MVKFLLIFFVISLILRFVLPVLMRWLVVGFMKKQTRRYSQQFGANPFQAPAEPPRNHSTSADQVRVDYVPPKAQTKRPVKFEDGDYVDFEEVK